MVYLDGCYFTVAEYSNNPLIWLLRRKNKSSSSDFHYHNLHHHHHHHQHHHFNLNSTCHDKLKYKARKERKIWGEICGVVCRGVWHVSALGLDRELGWCFSSNQRKKRWKVWGGGSGWMCQTGISPERALHSRNQRSRPVKTRKRMRWDGVNLGVMWKTLRITLASPEACQTNGGLSGLGLDQSGSLGLSPG